MNNSKRTPETAAIDKAIGERILLAHRARARHQGRYRCRIARRQTPG